MMRWGSLGIVWLAATAHAEPTLVPLADVAPKVVQEMRYRGSDNFLGRTVAGYEQGQCLLTPPAAQALARVQQRAEAFGLGLKVYDCYRPQRSVDDFVDWAGDLADTRMKHQYYPQVPKSELFAQGYIAVRSGHSRGSTVDLTLVSATARQQPMSTTGGDCRRAPQEGGRYPSLPMGSGYDCFDTVSHTRYPHLDETARHNRLLLLLLMESEGFSNYDKEWWHFTLDNEPYPDRYFDLPLSNPVSQEVP
ncbi:M15 family metallopeptidase [Ferrimonas balearica]|uniref:M15 family metallopeptidase n=1 Tax=Ferrimonas balearica TaxID=44012 RepID=UPI001C59B24D|nr:M15 family metallopeptidase [Ferrimonas balearica]MBW3139273.1 M15 family metallopeptidase [Ferrimonas balearica]MBY6106337.1 M15 family metallopeptidase [Ferrimonas balearica]